VKRARTAARGLDPASRAAVTDFYARSLKQWGPQRTMAVWWASPRTQARRFSVLAEVGAWEGRSVADVGCGVGDLFGFLEARGLNVRYHGYDINPAMVEAARAKYPHPRARFELRDPLARGLGRRRYDYVVASGTFNIRYKHGHDRYLRRAVAGMFAACRRAAAFNVLVPIPAAHPDAAVMEALYGEDDVFHHVDLEALLAECRRLAPRVEARTGYLDWDATVLLFR
jgi:SAM-dependent methyltransferase